MNTRLKKMAIILVLSTIILDGQTLFGATKKKVLSRKTQNVNFEADTVDGKGVSPDGAYLVQKRSVDFVPLYKVRQQLDENIKASTDYLK